MANEFADAMRGQFDAAQLRLSDDAFADDFGTTIRGRVKRRRSLSNAAVGGGTVVAVGAIAIAAMYLPRGSTGPAATPSACVTTTPAPDPFPVVTVTPDPAELGYDVALPNDAGTMTLTLPTDSTDELTVTMPDGSTFSVPRDTASVAFVFKIPELHLSVVAVQDFMANLKVSIGGVDAVVTPGSPTSIPRVVSGATKSPAVDCGDSDAAAISSPFDCGFKMNDTVHEDDALAIVTSGYKTREEAEALSSSADVTVTNPPGPFGDFVVPFATVVNDEGEGSLAAGLDPATQRPDKQLPVTGVSIVKVERGVVVAVADLGDPPEGVTRAYSSVTKDGESIYVLDKAFFEACPGVTSTADADFYAVAGSQTWPRYHAGEPPRYVWEALHVG